MGRPSTEHEKYLGWYIEELEAEGYRVVRMHRKIPDAVATKDGKLYAVEMMGKSNSFALGTVNKHNLKQKTIEYNLFDGLLYKEFRYPKKKDPFRPI